MTATVHCLEAHRTRRMAEIEAEIRADEATAGAQIQATWATALSRHEDPTVAMALTVADVLDELLEADDHEAMKMAALQLANGARMVAMERARRGR